MGIIARPTHLDPEFYFTQYVMKAPESDMLKSLEASAQMLIDHLNSIHADKAGYRYAEGKWSVKQLIQHVTDAERILAYRALRISRGDKTELQAYDEDLLAMNDNTNALTLKEVVDELVNVRKSTMDLFKNMSDKALDLTGTANGYECSARLLGWTISGHLVHHLEVLKERY